MNIIEGLKLLKEDDSRKLLISKASRIEISLDKARNSIMVKRPSLSMAFPSEEKCAGICGLELFLYKDFLCSDKEGNFIGKKEEEEEEINDLASYLRNSIPAIY